jgi:hypothetical protein
MQIAAHSSELELYDPMLASAWEQKRDYSPAAEWFVLLLWVFLYLEGQFSIYLQAVVEERAAFWTRITPFALFPSELVFYGPILIIATFIALRGRTAGYQTSRGLWLLVILWIIHVAQALHGILAGSQQRLWLRDLRGSVLPSFVVVMICALAPRIRLAVFVERFCKIGVGFGIYNGIVGSLVFTGTLEEKSFLIGGMRATYILTLMYILAFTRLIFSGKRTTLMLWALAFGVVAPLHKPVITGFAFANVAALVLFVLTSRRFGVAPYLRTTRVALVMGVFFVVVISWLFTLGGGTAKEYVERRFLKTNVSVVSRDISEARFGAWKWGFEQWQRKPIVGTGLGFPMAIQNPDGLWVPLGIHNIPLTTLYETGLIGFIIIMTIVFIWHVRIFRFLRICPDPEEHWPLLGMYIWIWSLMFGGLYGHIFSLENVAFILWMCVGFLTNAEAQWVMASNEEYAEHPR